MVDKAVKKYKAKDPKLDVVLNDYKKKLNELKEETEKIYTIDQIGDIEIPVFNATSATTLTLTWDATTRDLDVTSQTSGDARWALISVWWSRVADSTNDFVWYKYEDDSNPIVTLSSDKIGGVAYRQGEASLLPLDSSQRIKYNAPANTSSELVVLYGYIEIKSISDLVS